MINTQKSVWSRMQVELGAPKKDVLVVCDDRDSAVAVAMDIRNEIEAYDHIQTGDLLNSITPTVRDGSML